MTRFLICVITALLIMTAGMLIRGGILFGGEDMLALAILVWGAAKEVRHVNKHSR